MIYYMNKDGSNYVHVMDEGPGYAALDEEFPDQYFRLNEKQIKEQAAIWAKAAKESEFISETDSPFYVVDESVDVSGGGAFEVVDGKLVKVKS